MNSYPITYAQRSTKLQRGQLRAMSLRDASFRKRFDFSSRVDQTTILQPS